MFIRIALILSLVLSSLPLAAQTSASDRYLVLVTKRTKTLRAELDAALARGYTIVAGEPASDIMILEKTGVSASRKYLLDDNLFKTIKVGTYRGYRILPWSFSRSRHELGAVLESVNEGEPQPEYKLSATEFTRNLQKDLEAASAGGYRAVAMAGLDSQAALLERNSDGGQTPTTYQLLATKRLSTMEKELAAAAALGFKVVAATGADREILVLMEKQDPGAPNRDYRLVSTSKTSTFERELNEAAAAGYRVVPGTSAAIEKSGFYAGASAFEQAVIMERVAGSAPLRYMLLGARREKTLERELNAAPAGCKLDTMFLSYLEALVLLACPAQ